MTFAEIGFVLLLVTAALAGGCASSIMLRPDMARESSQKRRLDLKALDPAPEVVQVTNEFGNRLTGYLFARPGDRGTVLVSGGNAMGADETFLYDFYLLDHGFRVLVFSFQGYDDNPGDADLASLPGDAEAFYRFALARFPDEPVIYLASSVSTAAALCLPQRAPDLAGVVLDAAVNLKTVPYSKLGQAWFLFPLYPLLVPAVAAVSWSVPASVDPSECLEQAPPIPALFLHHPQDRIVPMSGALSLFEDYPGAAQFDKLDGGRKDPYHLVVAHDPAARRAVIEFIDGRFNVPAPPPAEGVSGTVQR